MMNKFHGFLSVCLIIALVSQGLFSSLKTFGIPIWGFLIILFIPFYAYYAKFIINISSGVIRRHYYFLFTIVISLTVLNIYSYNFQRIAVIPCGLLVASVIFYEFRYSPHRFIKIICILILVESLVSIIQFHFDIGFFEDYKRKTMRFSNGIWQEENWDSGSSGTFGFPVPYGYFMATFIPIVFPFVISFYKSKRKLYKISLIIGIIFCYYGFLLSMQRAAILISMISIFILSFIVVGYKKSFIIILSLISILILTESFNILDKDLFSLTDIIERVSNQTTWIQDDMMATENESVASSPHMYFYNIFNDYGLLLTFLILLFYIRSINILYRFKKYGYQHLPIGTFIGAILSILSYNIVALFHNNGQFFVDIVGYISFGYIFVICNVVAKSYSTQSKNIH